MQNTPNISTFKVIFKLPSMYLFVFGCAGFSLGSPLVAPSRGYSLVAVHGLLTAVVSPVVEHMGFSSCRTCAQYLELPGSRAQAQ